MTKINGNIQDQTCPDYTIKVSKQVADVFRQRQEDRVPRFDALRQLVELSLQSGSSEDSPSGVGTITVRISALADAWHWHRHTTKTFLEELAASGALTMEKTSGGVSLHLNCIMPATGE